MKRSLFVVLGILAALALVAIPASVTHAETGALCTVDPSTGPIGTVFHIECVGYAPSTIVNAYYVEPDGAAVTWGSIKTNEAGQVGASFGTKFGNEAATAYGTYTVVIDQTGLAKSIIYHGEISFRVTGGTEGVSGAKLWTDKTKATQGEVFSIYGSGFEPNEIVSVWFEYPNGDCSSFTFHDVVNSPGYIGLSTFLAVNLKADATGNISDSGYLSTFTCEGTYHIVARGNTSHRGADTWIAIGGNEVHTSAWLYPSSSKVVALFGTISFTGGGFGANEPVTCWVTTPEGQAITVFPDAKSDSSGGVGFSIYTGSYIPSVIAASEGASGEYSMSCRGNISHRNAIAQYQVTGGTLDP